MYSDYPYTINNIRMYNLICQISNKQIADTITNLKNGLLQKCMVLKSNNKVYC